MHKSTFPSTQKNKSHSIKKKKKKKKQINKKKETKKEPEKIFINWI